MAVNKVVNKQTKSHGAMRNVISYVLRDDKIKEGYVEITGPYSADRIDWDNVYQAFLLEKRIWGKDSGRMYAHNIISFHKDEAISPGECLEIGRAFADRFFPEYQNLVGVHQDRDHLHIHIVTNSVSYIDGRKLHQTKRDLERQKAYTNTLCKERGYTITEKGKHFDGTPLEEGEIRAWSKDKYHLFMNESRKSFVADCAIAIMKCVPLSANKVDFIQFMLAHGWIVHWHENRKHIVFENPNGEKIRDSNISKTFNMNIGKEALTDEFERQAAIRKERTSPEYDTNEFARYYAEVESALSGINIAEAVRDYTKTADGNTDPFIREFDPQEQATREERDDRLPEQLHEANANTTGREHDKIEVSDCPWSLGRIEHPAGSAQKNISIQEDTSRKERDNRITGRTDQNAERCRISTERKRTPESRKREATAAHAKRKRQSRSR